ncbi:PREDICTED: UPF0691 protein C9orf116 homolog [Condylura cristata]|uniref:UPF0691 protein C9orf116 homolog n=1 Tax=Condylura cristata TaxID=143302 RepID=UPI00064397EB|nr:PREDICTED: UPF0691 protein C9orf116 homolog [Condylura cristata]
MSQGDPQECAERAEPEPRPPAEKTSDFYRVSEDLPARFNNPACFRGYSTGLRAGLTGTGPPGRTPAGGAGPTSRLRRASEVPLQTGLLRGLTCSARAAAVRLPFCTEGTRLRAGSGAAGQLVTAEHGPSGPGPAVGLAAHCGAWEAPWAACSLGAGCRLPPLLLLFQKHPRPASVRLRPVSPSQKVFYPSSSKFSRQLAAGGMFQSNSLNVCMDKSSVTGPGNRVTRYDRLNFHPSYNARQPSICS